jgi:hypothetical protein
MITLIFGLSRSKFEPMKANDLQGKRLLHFLYEERRFGLLRVEQKADRPIVSYVSGTPGKSGEISIVYELSQTQLDAIQKPPQKLAKECDFVLFEHSPFAKRTVNKEQ